MGIPFHSYFGAIVALQFGSFVGVLWLTANQYQIQNQLWHLQSQLDTPGELIVEPEKAIKVTSGGGDPSGGPDPGRGFEANRAPKVSDVGSGPDSFSVRLSGFQLMVSLLLILLGLLIAGYLVIYCERGCATSLPLSPKAQKELAQRQLAEVRLKRHVFGREASSG